MVVKPGKQMHQSKLSLKRKALSCLSDQAKRLVSSGWLELEVARREEPVSAMTIA